MTWKSSNGDVSKLSAERHPIKSHRIPIEINRKKLNPIENPVIFWFPQKKKNRNFMTGSCAHAGDARGKALRGLDIYGDIYGEIVRI